MAEQTRIGMSVADYEALPESRHPIQLIEGELFEVPTPVPLHQRLSRQLMFALAGLRPDGEVLYAPMAVVLDNHNVLQPDVMWIAPNSRCVVTTKWILAAPALVVEILSPSTARYDKSVKFLLYEKHGAREYWIIDPERRSLEVWTRQGSEFVLFAAFGADQSFVSPLLGQTVDLAAVFTT